MTESGLDTSAPLGEWFSRPIRAAVYTWAENSDFNATINPWYTYFSNPEVYSKIKGFSRLKCKLHVKLMINSSPFMYSIGMMSYRPLAGGVTAGGISVPPFSGGHCAYALNTSQAYMAHSQYQHAMFYPHKSQGCELVLPFTYPSPWVNLQDSDLDTLRVMGNVYIQSFQPLYNSSGTAQATPINISLYIWASDVVLSGPSMSLQSDEYVEGPVSAPASAMARAMSSLSWVPVIGPYLRASSVVATKIGDVAKLFGYSNPPVIAPVNAVIIKPCINLATPIVSTQIEKVAMDPKNELSISGVPCGATSMDEMCFTSFQNRDVYIGQATWSTTATYDSYIMSMFVTPVNYINALENVLPIRYMSTQMTPGCLLAQNFEYWRGDIVYTFKIACSAFHRGRLRIMYDPNGYPNLVSPFGVPRVHQHIWDISESDTFQITVPFMAPTQWLECTAEPFSGSQTARPFEPNSPVPSMTYLPGFHNGMLQVSVINELTSAAGGSATVIAFVNTKNVEFASPKPMSDTNHIVFEKALSFQSDVVIDDEPIVEIVAPVTHVIDDVTTMGESVRSIRSIIKRSLFWDTIIPAPVPAAGSPQMDGVAFNYDTVIEYMRVRWSFPRFPIPRHIVPYEAPFKSSTGVFPWTIFKKNLNEVVYVGCNARTLPLTVFAACFVGWRGSVVWRAFAETPITNAAPQFADLSIQPERVAWQSYLPSVQSGTDLRNNNLVDMSCGFVMAITNASQPTTNDAYVNLQKSRSSINYTQERDFSGVVKQMTNYGTQCEAIMPMYTPYFMFPGNSLTYQKLLTNATLLDNYYGLSATSSDTISIDRGFKASGAAGVTAAAVADVMTGNVQLYAAAGDDMSFFAFVAVPTMYRPLTVQPSLSLLPYIAKEQ